MMDCPKCGFTQPEDKYCANCGVNVVSFRNKPISLQTRVLNNPWTYFFILGILTTGLFIFISLQPNSQIALKAKSWILKTDSSLQGTSNLSDSNPQEPQDSATQLDASSVANSSSADLDESNSADAEEVTPNDQESTTPLAESEDGQKAKSNETSSQDANAQKQKGYKVSFVEFARNKMENIIRASQILNESTEVLVLSVKSDQYIDRMQKFDSEMMVLPGQQESLLGKNTKALNFLFSDESGEEFGMRLKLNSKESEKKINNLELSIFVQLKFQDTAAQKFQFNHEATYNLEAGSTLLISPVLPRQKLNSELQESLANSPLKVFDSPEFLGPESPTEWLIVIEPI